MEKRFLCLWSGQAASMLGDQMVPIALAAWIIQSPAHGASSLGLVLAGRALAMALFVPVGGVVADRFSRRRVMIACDVVRTAAVTSLVLAPTDAPALQLSALTFVLGAGEAFFRPAFRAEVPALVHRDRLAWANSLNSIATTTSGLLGPALAGVLVATVDYRAALGADLVTFACSTATLLALGREGTAPREDRRRSLYADAVEGVRAVADRRWVSAVLVVDAAHILLAVAPWLVLLPMVSVDRYGPRGYGFLMAAFAAGGLCGGLVAMRHRPSRPGLSALLAQALFVLPLLALVPAGLDLQVLIVLYAVAGAGSEYNTVLWTGALQQAFPGQLMGRVSALSSLASTMLMPVGLAVTGSVAGVAGSDTLLVFGAVVVVASTAAVLPVPGVLRFTDPPTTTSVTRETAYHGDS